MQKLLNIPFVKAMTDGVVLEPSAFSITFGFLPSIIATHEFVVPKSIPITGPLTPSDLNLLCSSQEEQATFYKRKEKLKSSFCLKP